ncbi:SRPBCC family protein [Egicoccus sp. AB-alg2]|uniref:SRPBCC family protein n=1 Tax=Egicoccus sp. AB-alg2 TaxID=3242693 RepID=UPI00359E2D76
MTSTGNGRMARHGEVVGDGDRRTVRFERHLDASPEEVWDALTNPVRLARWLAPTTIDEGPAGHVHHDFGDGQACEGPILTWDPPRALEYGWHYTGESDSVVRFELAPAAGGTVLTLVHRQLDSDQATGYGAGWHAHLDRLAAELAGDADAFDWGERFAEVLPDYR